MIKAVKLIVLALAVLSAGIVVGKAQTASQIAEEEAVRRQEAIKRLRLKLEDGQKAQKEGKLQESAKLYDEARMAFQQLGSLDRLAPEKQKIAAGCVSVRMELARRAIKNGDLADADSHLKMALQADPENAAVKKMKLANDVAMEEEKGMKPSPEAARQVHEAYQDKATNSVMVQDGKALFEAGKLDEAEAILKKVAQRDPDNTAAYYYLNLISQSRYNRENHKRDVFSKKQLVEIEEAWNIPIKRDALPVPNPMARTNLVYTSKGRGDIISKLDRIRLSEIFFDGLPLGEVIKQLRDESKKRDPEQKGINFLINSQGDAPMAALSPDAAAGGDPMMGGPVDLSTVTIKINPGLSDVRMADILDAVVKVAEQPIKYNIEDYGVVFSPKTLEAVPLFNRIFRVDPNTFVQGLESVTSISVGNLGGSTRGGGGGGGRSSSGGQQTTTSFSIPRVSVVGGGGGVQQGAGVGGGAGSINFVTRPNTTQTMHDLVRSYFTSCGVDLSPPKSVFFNDRTGVMFVHASLSDLEIIQTAIETLNIAPPQLTIEAKFAEVSQKDVRALGFDWFMGNILMNNGSIGMQPGTAPSYQGRPSAGNPSGFFPGPGVETPVNSGNFLAGPGTIPQTAADGLLTGQLQENQSIPAVATLTGILTDPQFRVVIRAMEQRGGIDILSAPKVTTLSGRQAQVAILDLQTIVTQVSLDQTQSGGNYGQFGGGGGGGSIGSSVNFETESMPFGPVLDVMPTVSADGYSIQMAIIPTVVDFVGYDDPGQFIPQSQSVGGSTVGIPLRAQLPLPRLRMRQVTTTVNVWDGQTVVLGGLITDNIRKVKDKIPVLGDLPLLGRFFRSESNTTEKKNLVIFITPTLIDPAGNPLHTQEELPFTKNSYPSQPAGVTPLTPPAAAPAAKVQ